MLSFLQDKRLQELNKPRVFWDTQPVPKFSEIKTGEEFVHIRNNKILKNYFLFQKEGEIDTDKDPKNVRETPYPLLEQFEWTDIDFNNPNHVEDVKLNLCLFESILIQVYVFLTENYVEDDDNMFRFDYSKDFLKWALTPPGYYPEWIIGTSLKLIIILYCIRCES